ncbi:M48 family metallopeptidase [Pseudomonas matsuisoli]|uniref:Peptidase M48 n=1 Tax=Pseudomonas matsuisoli TaxID=1515666 RepID=A0A917PZ12_9PSED|nr:M48 family metallopeptidase [Pseudomonas matsuisoli]GGK00885.1 peptidase M48 [Pseudomonas matsuisoli]
MNSPVPGFYCAAGSSHRQHARLHVSELGLEIRAGDESSLAGPAAVADVEISSRIGNTPRFLRFTNGGSFETGDNEAIDAVLNTNHPRHGLLHRLESHWRYVVLGLLVTVLFAWGGVRYGVPAVAEALAFTLPESVSRKVGDGALAVMDQGLLGPSTLPAGRQAELQLVLMDFAKRVDPGLDVQVVFRDTAKTIGPNALALPSGTIVFTDQLVQLAPNDEELLAVMAHEMGHLDRRHALRRLIQSSALGILAMALVGDVSSVSSLVTAVPVILTELGYSRAFEYEADRYAAEALVKTGIPVSRLTAMLERLEQTHCDAADDACSQDDWRSYVSTHPGSVERARAIQDR